MRSAFAYIATATIIVTAALIHTLQSVPAGLAAGIAVTVALTVAVAAALHDTNPPPKQPACPSPNSATSMEPTPNASAPH